MEICGRRDDNKIEKIKPFREKIKLTKERLANK